MTWEKSRVRSPERPRDPSKLVAHHVVLLLGYAWLVTCLLRLKRDGAESATHPFVSLKPRAHSNTFNLFNTLTLKQKCLAAAKVERVSESESVELALVARWLTSELPGVVPSVIARSSAITSRVLPSLLFAALLAEVVSSVSLV